LDKINLKVKRYKGTVNVILGDPSVTIEKLSELSTKKVIKTNVKSSTLLIR